MDINGVAVVVAGGASGLGAATVRMLAAAGAKVAIFDRDSKQGSALAAELGGVFHPVEVSSEVSVEEGLLAAEGVHGVARVLVNCAGIVPIAKTVANDGKPFPPDIIRDTVNVNLVGTLILLSQFAALLTQTARVLEEERGVIINTASTAAYDGSGGQLAYAASKGGVVSLTLPAARDLAPFGIRVMTIAPGMYHTPMVGMLSEEAQNRLGHQVPFPNRLGKPEEFAQLVMSIVANPMLNGEVIRIDGAYRLPA